MIKIKKPELKKKKIYELYESGKTIEEISEKARLDYSRTAELARILEIDGFICIDLLQRCTINFRNNM